MLLMPVLFIYLTVMNEKERYVAHFGAKVALWILTLLFAGALVYMLGGARHQHMNYFAALGNLYLDAFNDKSYIPFSCGFFGGLLGYPLAFFCGNVVATILCILILIALIFILTNLSVKDVARAASRTVDRAKRVSEEQRRRYREKMEQRRQQQEEQARQRQREQEKYGDEREFDSPVPRRTRTTGHSGGAIDIPLDAPAKKRRRKPSETEEQQPVEQNTAEVDYIDSHEGNASELDLSADLINIINRADRSYDDSGSDSTMEHIADTISREKRGEAQPPEEKPEKPSKRRKKEETEIPEEFGNLGYSPDSTPVQSVEDEKPRYSYPPVQLLRPNENNNDLSAREELEQNSRKLIDTLQSFGVNAKIVNICRGPSVTRYELQPAPGVKISKITNLSDDIALNLAANGVRIEAPIPGKAAVGIEVPNKVVSMVSMRELIDSDVFRRAKSKLTAVLGRDIEGEIVVTDIAKMPHLLIAGTTGSGKSVCVNSILISILYKATPDEVKLLLIDPKMVEFSKYKGIPHLLVPIVSDAKKAAGALGWAVNEMLNRYKIFSEYDCKDIDSYNSLIEKNLRYIDEHPPVENEDGVLEQPVMEVGGLPVAKEKMSRVVIAIDELADLMMAAPSEVEDSICRLAQMARAAGMHLILATQRPTVNVITGLIKANVPSRIALKVSSNMDSRTILDTGGGEKLIGRGDMLFSPVGAPKPIRIQGCYASEEEIESVTGYIKKSAKAEYNAEIEESIKRIATEEIAQGKKRGSDDEGDLRVDDKMEEAIQFVIESGQASTSMLQRRLKVGYARAGRMIDDMEQLGVVGPHQGSKPRDVLMTYSEWLERRNVLQNRSESG
ncbi:MAG: DNA translocase FtsK [Ruminococcus sp.]|nr:DNA translocase FtsK [Ruminococcus sp.]